MFRATGCFPPNGVKLLWVKQVLSFLVCGRQWVAHTHQQSDASSGKPGSLLSQVKSRHKAGASDWATGGNVGEERIRQTCLGGGLRELAS